MTQTFDDIDGLIGRVRAAAHDSERHDRPLPPPLAYRQRLGELLQGVDDVIPLRDPAWPQLEELLLPSRSDDEFIVRAYRVLLDREPDWEGREHYLQALPKVGRLYVLAELMCTEACRHRQAAGELSLPAFQRLTLPLRLQRRLRAPGRRLQPLVQRLYRDWQRRWWPRLARRESLRGLEWREPELHRRLYGLLMRLDGEAQRLAHADAQRARQLQQQQRQLQQQAQRLETLAHSRQAIVETLHALLPDGEAADSLLRRLEALGAQPRQAVSQQEIDDYYLAFEAVFRGDEEQVRTHLQRYLPQLEQALDSGRRALDLGCGRGEWLQLLAEQGFDAYGVDLNATMVAHCREQGLAVEEGDLLETLRAQPDASHGLISAFHIAEHLPFDVLYSTLQQARRILAPGGVLIIETPNPENVLVGSHTFYHDPTHRNPLTPTSLRFLLEFHGFRGIETLRFNPYPESAKVPGDDPLTERVNGHLCGPQDYALVAVSPHPEGRYREALAEEEQA